MHDESNAQLIRCQNCGAEAGSKLDRLGRLKFPRGWKRDGEGFTCRTCWEQRFTLRAVRFTVVTTVDAQQNDAFWTALRASWRMSTSLANWCIVEAAKSDFVRLPAMEKPPPYKAPYLYPLARKLLPELSTAAVVAILNTVQAQYRKARFDVLWLGRAALPTFRYPYPYPLGKAAWSARWLNETDRVPVISVTLCGTRFEVRLKGGPGFHPQRQDFSDLIEGKAQPCEMALYQRGDHLMAKLVMWCPKVIRAANEGPTLSVATDAKSLLVAAHSERQTELWRFNADHVRRWVAEYGRVLGRLQEDSKASRWTKQICDPAAYRERIVRKHQDRMQTVVHQATAAALAQALRIKARGILYDGREQSYIPTFPWARLALLLEQKAKAIGLEWMVVSNEKKES